MAPTCFDVVHMDTVEEEVPRRILCRGKRSAIGGDVIWLNRSPRNRSPLRYFLGLRTLVLLLCSCLSLRSALSLVLFLLLLQQQFSQFLEAYDWSAGDYQSMIDAISTIK